MDDRASASPANVALAERVEAAAQRAWPALEEVPVGDWLVRLSGGYTKRANSVNPRVGAPAEPPEDVVERIAHCEALYRSGGLPPIHRLTPFTRPANLDGLLAERGYGLLDPTAVQMLDLGAWRPPLGRAAGRPDELPIERFLALHAACHGRDGVAPLHRAIVERVDRPLLAMAWTVEGRAAACGLAVLDGDLVGVFDLVTHPAQRRKGYARALMVGLLDRGRRRGARVSYLQVVEANSPALALYASLGYVPLYHYWYRVQD